MKLDSFLKIIAYGAPLIGFAVILWGPQIQAMNDPAINPPPLYSNKHLSAEPIQPIPNHITVNTDIAELGGKLFSDSRLSEKGFACTDCHNLSMSGTDGNKVSINIQGGNDFMNTPTIFNASLNPLLTWYGRNKTLEQQLDGVIANKKHMGGNWINIIKRLKQDKEYTTYFDRLFPDGLTQKNIKHAIASFERTLITPNSPFDNYLLGDEDAITISQKMGYKLFKQYGCISCHQGINVGGNLHAILGAFSSPFKNKKFDTPKRKFNLGRYNISKKESDKHVFRVPSLRNVAVTSPYFHNGGISDLKEAVKFMAKYQTGREMKNEDAQLITDFLHSLTGKYNGNKLIAQYIVRKKE